MMSCLECLPNAILTMNNTVWHLQDFWNVSADDPLVHFARFFYGEQLPW
jgi:hypothetical protein